MKWQEGSTLRFVTSWNRIAQENVRDGDEINLKLRHNKNWQQHFECKSMRMTRANSLESVVTFCSNSTLLLLMPCLSSMCNPAALLNNWRQRSWHGKSMRLRQRVSAQLLQTTAATNDTREKDQNKWECRVRPGLLGAASVFESYVVCAMQCTAYVCM